MAKVSIPLKYKTEELEILFSYPNTPGDAETLEQTILHWVGQTLTRDGLDPEKASVHAEGGQYVLELDGLSDTECAAYAERYPKILAHGWEAWTDPVATIKSRQVWSTDGVNRSMWNPNALTTEDADGNKRDAWRFFLTLGVGIVNHRTLQFFHYPPLRLLDPLRDSMQDPVTYRCRDLLEANGVAPNETHLYETRINSTPIAAPDDQGTNSTPPANPVWGGLMPIGYFLQFEQEMIETLIKPHPEVAGYTIPMTAYGRGARQRFGGMFLNPDQAMVLRVLDGYKTPVLGSNHPYKFYYVAQQSDGEHLVGSGYLIPDKIEECIELQQEDLAVVRWQVEMAKDPSQDPWQVIAEAKAYWKESGQQRLVKALVYRHGSLTYDTPAGLKFKFALSLEEALEKVDSNS